MKALSELEKALYRSAEGRGGIGPLRENQRRHDQSDQIRVWDASDDIFLRFYAQQQSNLARLESHLAQIAESLVFVRPFHYSE